MLHCQIQTLRLEFFSRKATYTRVGLLANNLALLPSLRQEFKRFQFAVGQRYAAMCKVLAMHVAVPTNVKLSHLSKTMIFKAKINTTHVALNISCKAGS